MESKTPSHPRFDKWEDVKVYVEAEARKRAKRRFLESVRKDDPSRANPSDVRTLQLECDAEGRI